ncbi:MAG: tRNA (N6-isopentenyl adenosine(37)-C2)-methylthiotransferase MiaB [Pseudomonadota bacterium]
MPKKVHIATYGCQMNDYESDRAYRMLAEDGAYHRTDDPAEADLFLFNTCSVREKADQKALSEIGTLRALKAERPEMLIAVGGCLSQSMGAEIQERFPFVDIVFGTHQWGKLSEMIRRAGEERTKLLEIDLYGCKNYTFLPYRHVKAPHPVAELVTVQNGCDKFCTFCLVPFTRGRQVSRPHGDVIAEIGHLTDQGVREVTLLGQNVNAYGEDRSGEIRFGDLLREVCRIPALDRVRFVTSHPSNLSTELIDRMAGEEKVCKHLHLPVQSGSDPVLERMKREYTVDQYRHLAEELRSKIPGISITTDFIVGFPGETDADFERTLALLREVEFEDSFSFKYSPRAHTKAAGWEADFIPTPTADERLARLQTLQTQIRRNKQEDLLGQQAAILIEGSAKKGSGMLTGRTSQNRWVNFPGPSDWIGTRKVVRITESLSNSFRGIAL